MTTLTRRRGLTQLGVSIAAIGVIVTILSACERGNSKEEHADDGGSHTEASDGHGHDKGQDGHVEGKVDHAEDKDDNAEGHDDHAEGGGALKLSAEQAQSAGIRSEAIQARPLIQTVVATATIKPDQNRLARVSPRIDGRISAVPTNAGDKVESGQVLATLDSVDVGEAHTAWIQARSDLRIADADLKRAKTLVADEIIPRKDYLRAQADRAKAASAVRATANRLRLLGGSTDAGKSDPSAFTLNAPFAGTVIAKHATPGDLATPSDPLFTIADLSQVWVEADLPETALSRLRVGANAKISVPAYPSEIFNGRVDYIGQTLSRETRTVSARIVVANEDRRLKPEMFATATIEVGSEGRMEMTVPDAAIVLMDGVQSVFVLDQDGYEVRAVQPGERISGRTVIEGGVEPGEVVVLEGAYALKARKLKSQLGHGH
tara:strand:- start:2616 stop:3914 length:1299 start_codon:yes stop_codon:yes gene_type:complete